MGVNVNPDQPINNYLDNRFSGSGQANGGVQKPSCTPKEALAASVEDLLVLRDRIAKTPLGGAVILIHALLNYTRPATRAMGQQQLVLSVAEDMLQPGTTYKGYALKDELVSMLEGALPDAQHALASLVAGSSQATSYAYDPAAVSFLYDAVAEQGQDPRGDTYTVRLLHWAHIQTHCHCRLVLPTAHDVVLVVPCLCRFISGLRGRVGLFELSLWRRTRMEFGRAESFQHSLGRCRPRLPLPLPPMTFE